MVIHMENQLSTRIRYQQEWLKTLEETIRNHGMREFNRLAQITLFKPSADPEIIPSLNEFWSRLQVDFNRLLFRLRNTKRSEILGTILRTVPLGAGFLFSFPIPQTDFRFAAKQSNKSAIFFHRPLVLWARLFLSWLEQMLFISSLNSSLTVSEQRRFALFSKSLRHFGEGFDSGVYRKELLIKLVRAAKLKRKQGAVEFNLEPDLFFWLESQLELLQMEKQR